MDGGCVVIDEAMKCKCETPKPMGPFIYGLQKCATCGKIANWLQFEDDVVQEDVKP
jgi:hypothetical protein